jgi:hypothetical protein
VPSLLVAEDAKTRDFRKVALSWGRVTSWGAFIERASACDHAVQMYADSSELARSVGAFLAAGFRVGEPSVVIATADHWESITRDLSVQGWDPAALQVAGLLARADADETLAGFMGDDAIPSPERFEEVVGAMIDGVAARFANKTIRAFGEMVDVLWRDGKQHAAISLEELWNDLARTRRFALLCGYHLDIFDVEIQAQALPELFRVHSHARPAAEPSWLADAVDKALNEMLGPIEAARVYLDVAENVPQGALPRAQAVLAWVAANRKPSADEILERVRTHYLVMRSAPSASVVA